eukprot:TRINITY_DN17401_c0_g2_i1.p1 TRINITY_DN17401_c0_g2~~TRINITY_DN17401_c0_g2_i1.p1  ORF type:complete len:123 (-),score=8.83 TRINITY_DN17401_c0_g2_i1:194-562(-)
MADRLRVQVCEGSIAADSSERGGEPLAQRCGKQVHCPSSVDFADVDQHLPLTGLQDIEPIAIMHRQADPDHGDALHVLTSGCLASVSPSLRRAQIVPARAQRACQEASPFPPGRTQRTGGAA